MPDDTPPPTMAASEGMTLEAKVRIPEGTLIVTRAHTPIQYGIVMPSEKTIVRMQYWFLPLEEGYSPTCIEASQMNTIDNSQAEQDSLLAKASWLRSYTPPHFHKVLPKRGYPKMRHPEGTIVRSSHSFDYGLIAPGRDEDRGETDYFVAWQPEYRGVCLSSSAFEIISSPLKEADDLEKWACLLEKERSGAFYEPSPAWYASTLSYFEAAWQKRVPSLRSFHVLSRLRRSPVTAGQSPTPPSQSA